MLTLKHSSLDLRILKVRYILEILEEVPENEVRKVLVQQEVLKVVYHSIQDLQQNWHSDAD